MVRSASPRIYLGISPDVVFVPVPVDYVCQLKPDRIAVFDCTDDLARLVREAGFGFIVVERQAVRKIVAVGRKSDLVGQG